MIDQNAEALTAPAASYLAHAASLLARLADEQHESLTVAGRAVARTLMRDGLVHIFGSGHSHMLALEAFYRAGGLAAVDPVLVESLMLHGNAVLSTALERTAGIGDAVFADIDPGPDDTFILVSNSSRNQVAIELARAAQARGLTVIGILSRAHAESTAATAVPGIPAPMGPTSTVTGAAIIHAIAIEASAIAVASGSVPAVFTSSNIPGGDALNVEAIARYRHRVRSL